MPICQKNKSENVFTPRLLQPLHIPQTPFTNINNDFIKGMPKSDGKDVILVVINRFSKYAHLFALIYPYTASSVTKVLMVMSTNYMACLLLLLMTKT
jgi:hypothetical protein